MKRLLHALRAPLGGHGIVPTGAFRHLKVALISDELTHSCLAYECQVRDITPLNYKVLLKFWNPDLVFVESAWHGPGNAWKFKIAAYPDYPKRNNHALQRVIAYARDLGIPCVFWNKEDGVHFDRFIASASLFDTVLTVDENCVPRYRDALGPSARIKPLMFAVQPVIHSFSGAQPKHRRACFVGSYSHHIHDRRRYWQDIMFRAAGQFGVTVYDRNSSRKSKNYRYPEFPGLEIRRSVPHDDTGEIYRDYLVSLNVNTVEDSGTMFSRRLIEILACGGIAVTNPAVSVDRYFSNFCEVVDSEESCTDVFDRLSHGDISTMRERARAGAEYVLREHTWAHRVGEILELVG